MKVKSVRRSSNAPRSDRAIAIVEETRTVPGAAVFKTAFQVVFAVCNGEIVLVLELVVSEELRDRRTGR